MSSILAASPAPFGEWALAEVEFELFYDIWSRVGDTHRLST
jgi:hypothetical protein